MTCTPANRPELIDVTDLIYLPADYERRFLSGWWTRGVVPADNFSGTNWAGLIIPQKITFEENTITIEYPGRWWEDLDCNRSMPKVRILIQYLCKGGRLYLNSNVFYGKNYSQQTYAGNNGAQRFSRIPLEKVDEPCSLERTADIPLEKADVLEIKHLADWLVTMISAPGVTQVGEPNLDWISLFADYTESDLEWAPCDGCIFPTQSYSVPAMLSQDNMLSLEARLALQNIKALGELLIVGTVPETFNVPLCLHNTYLEVSLPSLSAALHMREFFSCDFQYFGDMYSTIPVKATDVIKCFQFPEPTPTWPARNDPRWVDDCPESGSTVCTLDEHITFQDSGFRGPSTPMSQFAAVNANLCSGSFFTPAKYQTAPTGYVLIISKFTKVRKRGKYCVLVSQYSGPDRQVISCVTTEFTTQEILTTKVFPGSGTGIDAYLQQMRAANANFGCGSTFNDPSGGTPPPQPNVPRDDNPQGPNNTGNCFLEGEVVYTLNLQTILGNFGFTASMPVRAKVPNGTVDLGLITGSLSGNAISINTALGGNFTANLSDLIQAYNTVGRTISSIIPVSFGLRNVRVLCP